MQLGLLTELGPRYGEDWFFLGALGFVLHEVNQLGESQLPGTPHEPATERWVWAGPPSGPGAVLMVYNLPVARITCDRVFNLFCLYGNVVRVKASAHEHSHD